MADVHSDFTVTYTVELCHNYPHFSLFKNSARSRTRNEGTQKEISDLQEKKIISLKMQHSNTSKSGSTKEKEMDKSDFTSKVKRSSAL